MNIELAVSQMRENFLNGGMRDLEYRRNLLIKYKANIKLCENELLDAFRKDFNKAEFDAYATEIGLVYAGINDMVRHLHKYARPRKVHTSLTNFPSKGRIYAEGFGVALIIGAWNYPFQLAILPLVGAIGAGNCVVLKPSTKTPAVTAVIEKINKMTFKETEVITVATREVEGKALLDVRYDYMFFTGSVHTGKKVMEAASKNVVPVSLEMGGKSPCVVDYDCDIKLTAKRIAWGKYMNAGQTCVCPDYFLVHEKVYDAFVKEFTEAIRSQYYPDGKNLVDTFPYLVDEKKGEEIDSLIAGEKILLGGKRVGRLLEPTVLGDITWESPIMQDEIFAPVAPLIKYSDNEDIIKKINAREKPLSLYYFGKSPKLFITKCSYGGGCISDTVMHVAEENLPFGGVGYSGIGSYHGKQSFDTFTHFKSVLWKGKMDINMRYSPQSKGDIKFARIVLK
ncbi:MAG: aldehyde dehydrogenase family protein [Clostridia bacterium]